MQVSSETINDVQDVFMIRMLPELLDKVTRVVADNLGIENLTIQDDGRPFCP